MLVAADHLLGRITPTVGLWPASRPDPLGDYLAALDRTIELDPEDRTARSRGSDRGSSRPCARAEAAPPRHVWPRRPRLSEASRSPGYQASFALFGSDLPPAGRRFAIAETLSHLERLVLEGAAVRHEVDGAVTYTARLINVGDDYPPSTGAPDGA